MNGKAKNLLKKFIRPLKKLAETIEDIENILDSVLIKFEQLKKEIRSIIDIEIKLLKSYLNKIKAWENTIVNFINVDIEEYIIWIDAEFYNK